MGFKVDASFLRYVTMGARGTLRVINELRGKGFEPIELERYSTSNKIWSTKIKRLRLPDLLCVRTGLRIEVRAKTDLKIRMSHAPDNADRHWDSGLKDDDVIALVPCGGNDIMPWPVGPSSYFKVNTLRASVEDKNLSGMKAASEGSEKYLEWPSVVSKRPGQVLETDENKLVVKWGGDGSPVRRYTYKLSGRRSYVQAGEMFDANVTILAGTPSEPADLQHYLQRRYNPAAELHGPTPVDRYAAVKAIRYHRELWATTRHPLEAMIGGEANNRVRLEAAGTATMLNMAVGMDYISNIVRPTSGDPIPDIPMQMEAILMATELGKLTGRQEFAEFLYGIASDREHFSGTESRQAAVWGLGQAGMGRYSSLLAFIDDDENDVALHAIAAFGTETDEQVISTLIEGMEGSPRKAAACSEALVTIGGETVLGQLISAAHVGRDNRPWVLATLGRLDANAVRGALASDPLLDEITPLLLASSGSWIATEDTAASLRFLLKQYPDVAPK
jgi:hypothetical protein